MIPDFQSLMRPVLECTEKGEIRIRDIVEELAERLELTQEERAEMLPSGRQTIFANRVGWAKTYLKQAGLIVSPKRAHVCITERGKQALKSDSVINNKYLNEFQEFQEFQSRSPTRSTSDGGVVTDSETASPEEIFRDAHQQLNNTLAEDLLDRVQEASPSFFEKLVVDLLISMGYGGSFKDAGQVLGQSGDRGVDGVINQDLLGVDRIYIQAKRYTDSNSIVAREIREFSGALGSKNAKGGIFFTTSSFTPAAEQEAKDANVRIVLIDGKKLTQLMLSHNIGCQNAEKFYLKKIDESFFDFD